LIQWLPVDLEKCKGKHLFILFLDKKYAKIKAAHQPFFFEEFSGLPEIYFFSDLLVPLRSFLKNGRSPARPENRLL
jgi:hypothetical protein